MAELEAQDSVKSILSHESAYDEKGKKKKKGGYGKQQSTVTFDGSDDELKAHDSEDHEHIHYPKEGKTLDSPRRKNLAAVGIDTNISDDIALNRLYVGDVSDKKEIDAMCRIPPDRMQDIGLDTGDYAMITGKNGHTVCMVIEDIMAEKPDEIKLNAVVRKNAGCIIGDRVDVDVVCPCYGAKLQLCIWNGEVPDEVTHEQLLENYVRPFLKNESRPVIQGDVIRIPPKDVMSSVVPHPETPRDGNNKAEIEFKVVGVALADVGPSDEDKRKGLLQKRDSMARLVETCCVVNDETEIEIVEADSGMDACMGCCGLLLKSAARNARNNL